MITTVSLNPCIDRTVKVKQFTYGGMNRVFSARSDAGGKAINVAVSAAKLGLAAGCIGLLYKENGRMFENKLLANGCACDFVWLEGSVRTNIKLQDESTGQVTEINESGMGDRCGHVPFEIKEKWNWGAFLMPVWWGLYNHVYQALLTCIPVFGFFYLFHLGSKGNELAWKHRYWESVEHFKKIQRRWALAALLITTSLLALNIGIRIAENRAAERLAAEEKAMKEKLAVSFEALPEWHAFLDGREEWTEEHKRAAQEKNAAYAPNPSDLFYFEETEYYRILYAHYFDFQAAGADISDAGEVVFPGEDEALSYRVKVQFSTGREYEILCGGDENGNLLTFDAVPDEAATEQNMTYINAVKAAGERRAAYLAERTAAVTAHPLFTDTFGDDYTFVRGPFPGFESYGDVYNGGSIEIGGFYAEVMSGGKLYYVEIPAELDGTEGELSIREAEDMPDTSGK